MGSGGGRYRPVAPAMGAELPALWRLGGAAITSRLLAAVAALIGEIAALAAAGVLVDRTPWWRP